MLAIAGALITVPQANAAASTRAACSYVARSGDSLAAIAERYYGAAADWPQLQAANSWLIADPAVIYPGQVFLVPCDQPASGTSGQPDIAVTAAALAPMLGAIGAQYGWGATQVGYWQGVINLESASSTDTNPKSGAFGWAQALGHGTPGAACPETGVYEYGADYGLTAAQARQANCGDGELQLAWMADYVAAVYRSPEAAYQFHLSHGYYLKGIS